MAGLTRYLQKLFGIDAGSNQMSKYGSFLTTPQLYDGATITPDIVQALSAFQVGQYGAVGGAYSPTIQDHNSLFYLAFYQLSYLLTRGIPEWDSGTTYNQNDFCKVNNVIYYSIIDNNTNNNPSSSPTQWKSNQIIKPTQQVFLSGSGTYTLPTNPTPLYLRVQMAGGGGGGSGAVRGSPIGTSAGGNGTSSSFYSSNLLAHGGDGGVINSTAITPGAGGSAVIGVGIGQEFVGQDGQFGTQVNFGLAGFFMALPGGNGGQNLLGGAGLGGGSGVSINGKAGLPDRGAAGGGGGIETTIPDPAGDVYISGVGGGAAGFLDAILDTNTFPSSTSYTVGTGGSGGAGIGSASGSGGAGSGGVIIVTEYYQ